MKSLDDIHNSDEDSTEYYSKDAMKKANEEGTNRPMPKGARRLTHSNELAMNETAKRFYDSSSDEEVDERWNKYKM